MECLFNLREYSGQQFHGERKVLMMAGHKVYLQDDRTIREGLICPFCELLLKDPVQTTDSGIRLCRTCFEAAAKDLSHSNELDPNDKIWPDNAVRREIGNLKVKCENCKVGCGWKGLFKELKQHLQDCWYAEIECDCGQKVLLIEMEPHLNKECPQRLVHCKDCGEKIYFNELQNHSGMCPNAIRMCRNCGKELLACQLVNHLAHECKHIRCVCSEGGSFERNQDFEVHLQDVDKLGEHLKPLISEFNKMAEILQEVSRKLSILETKNEVLERSLRQANERIECLEMNATNHETTEQMLKKKVEALEKEIGHLTLLVDKNHHRLFKQIDQSAEKVSELNDDMQKLKSETSDNHAQIVAQLEGINVAVASSNKTDSFDKPPPSADVIKQLEDQVLQLETILNAVGAARNSDAERISELELQLQASLSNTHNGTFVWRIPEVRRRIQDAVIGRVLSIYSPPFYTGRNGYKMCIAAYLNGDGSGKGTHLSIFVVLMKGEYDPLLQWPFESKVSLILVDQDHMKHLVQTFKPNPQSSSFQKPKTNMNVASGCPEFADLSILENPSYVKDDVMYIKAIVDTSKIFHP